MYTDFSEIVYKNGHAKAHLMPLLDHTSKLVVGHALGMHKNAGLALVAWTACMKFLKENGISTKGIILHHDQDGVYLGYAWLNEVLVNAEAHVSYSQNGARGNVHMESFFGRFKEENRMLFWEQEDLESLRAAVADRIWYYNHKRRHSALGDQSPIEYLKTKGLLRSSIY